MSLLDKEKLLAELKADIESGKEKQTHFDVNNPRDCVGYHIINDEIKYIQSLIDYIEGGNYDVVI